jgi:outer membrane protein OmpU
MNNITKIGLTALAGSLVASSAFAGAMSVSGTAKATYQSKGAEQVTGNPWSQSKGITFSGSGELDNGFSVSTGYTMTNAAFSSSYVSLDMGDSGTLHVMNGTSKAGLNKYQDKMPTAGEQVWDDVDATDHGVVGTGNDNALGYEVSVMGMTASASYQRNGLGTDTSFVLVADDLVEGAQFGYGIGSDTSSSTVEHDHSTAWATYTMGMATVGVQTSSIDKPSADVDRMHAAISLAVNENMSVSYGVSTVDFETSTLTDEESSGISASYTMGGMTLAAVMNKTDSIGGASEWHYSDETRSKRHSCKRDSRR